MATAARNKINHKWREISKRKRNKRRKYESESLM
jgi:hypothetical protein